MYKCSRRILSALLYVLKLFIIKCWWVEDHAGSLSSRGMYPNILGGPITVWLPIFPLILHPILLFCCLVLSQFRLFATPRTAACQASLFFTISWNLLKLMSIELVILSNHLLFCHAFFSCPQSFPASGSFPVSQLFISAEQRIGVSVSAAVLPMNI